jgi:cation/acetate symporter
LRTDPLRPALLLVMALALTAILLLAAVERVGLDTRLAALATVAVIGAALVASLVLSAAPGPAAFLRAPSFLAPLTHAALAAVAVLAVAMTLDPLAGIRRLVLLAAATAMLAAAVLAVWPALAAGQRKASLGDHLETRLSGGVRWPAVIGGLAVGVPLMVYGLQAAVIGLGDVTGLSGLSPLLLAAAILLAAALPGGARGLAVGLAAMALLAAVSVALPLATARWMLGPLPLPGITPADVLGLIAEERARWVGIDAGPPVLVRWPDPGALAADSLLAALWSAGLGLIVLAALPSAAPRASFGAGLRQALALLAVTAALALGLVAIGAYAIEAAGLGLAGASAYRPPGFLVELGRLGLVEVCGEAADTVAAIRRACGANALDGRALAAESLRFSARYPWEGLLVALGAPAALALPGRLFPAAAGLATALAGLSIAAPALAHDLFFRLLKPRAIASWRIAMLRLAVLALVLWTAALALRPGLGGGSAPLLRATLAGGIGLLVPLLLVAALPQRERVPVWPVALAAGAGMLVALAAADFGLDDRTLFRATAVAIAAGVSAGAAALALASAFARRRTPEGEGGVGLSPPPVA